jgi:hypothetical protein
MHWLVLLGLWILIGSVFIAALSDAIPTWWRRRQAWNAFVRAIEQDDPIAACRAALQTDHPTMIRWARLSQSCDCADKPMQVGTE